MFFPSKRVSSTDHDTFRVNFELTNAGERLRVGQSKEAFLDLTRLFRLRPAVRPLISSPAKIVELGGKLMSHRWRLARRVTLGVDRRRSPPSSAVTVPRRGSQGRGERCLKDCERSGCCLDMAAALQYPTAKFQTDCGE